MPVFASLFSGFGLADIGALQAGCELAWGVELDPQVAEVSRQLGHKIYNQSVLEIDWYRLEKPTDLWISPPCQKFSSANTTRGETPLDLELAKAVCEAIRALQPERVYLENVEAYKRSDSLKLIENQLYSLGYMCSWGILNSADVGVPQSRKRLILRAVKGGFVPPMPAPVKWRGWYSAIADLLPGLPDVELAPWQKKRLPLFFESTAKAYLVEGAGANTERLKVRSDTKPCWTIRASTGANRNISRLANAVLLETSRTVALNPRALARFQTLPDWYELPEKVGLACKGIGNGVPCKLAEAVVMSCLAAENYRVA